MTNDIKKFTQDPKIFSLLVSLSAPAIVSGLVDTLYNMVDSMFVGNYVGNEALAALAVIVVIQLSYLSVGVLFSVGNASLISRALGAQHHERAVLSLKHSFWSIIVISLTVSIVFLINLEKFLLMIGATPKTLPYAMSYGRVILWTGFILPVNNMLLGSFRAKGQAMLATRFNILGASMNVVLDALFIIVFQWGVAGAAYATAISQLVVFLLAIKKVRALYHTQFRFKNKSEFSLPLLKEIIAVGSPTGLRLMIFIFVATLVNRVLSPYGSEYLSAFSIYNRLIMILSMVSISLGIGSQPLIGMNYGAKQYDRVKKIIRLAMISNIVIGLLTTLIMSFSPEGMYLMFTKDMNIIKIAQKIAFYQTMTYVGWTIFITTMEALQAIGYAKESFWLSIAYPCMLGVSIYTLNIFFGLEGFYYSHTVVYLIIGITSIAKIKQLLHKLDRKHDAYKRVC